MRDKIMELIGRGNRMVIMWEGIVGALKLMECLWIAAGPEARAKAREMAGWQQATEQVRRAMDWG